MAIDTNPLILLAARLRKSGADTDPVDPKAVYRTKPVALFEEAAQVIEDQAVELAMLRKQAMILAAELQIAGAQFRSYQAQHVAKGTEDSLRKASVNQHRAEGCERALWGYQATLETVLAHQVTGPARREAQTS